MDRIFRVIVDEAVSIDCLHAGAPTFIEATDSVIQREQIAIERFHDNNAAGTLQGVFYFASLDNARSYALLNLQAAQERLAANMDRVLGYGPDSFVKD